MKWITALVISLLAFPSWAEQAKTIKDLEVHYSALNSTFLTPQIAKNYKLKRNGYTAILNISILDRSKAGKPATEATINATSKNLVGNSRKLAFNEIKEGDAIYYIAEFPITNEENITFDINIDAGTKGAGTIKFNQKFYVEE
ncbi:DUF4426 domain-containing protein [Vibrio marisflavi]|uniref:DUF4426 domain-containing protein n=1 Tax=Vibrio marisflavi CECT 7928 TaxID=634439 RepID=A0ABN8E680_9VIBR|nr:DUF4426 domain-containing protein [Vibrio marisflavi]CAH0538507.1 hypothetical protein VMF7928_01428 [Vibrio marisflavi CECT 7928]